MEWVIQRTQNMTVKEEGPEVKTIIVHNDTMEDLHRYNINHSELGKKEMEEVEELAK